MVAQSMVMNRASTVWTPGTVPYSQSTIHQPDGYRQDCSGYVSMCWMVPLSSGWGGESTVTLVTEGWMYEIPFAELQAGDAVGLCGPGTAGNDGHIQLVESYNPATGSAVIWEQAGGVYGPVRRTVKRITAGYRAYRYRGIEGGGGGGEEDDMTPDQDRMLKDVWSALFEDAMGTDRPRQSLIGLTMFPSDAINLILSGVSRLGHAADDPDPQIAAHVPGKDLRSVEERLSATTEVDVTVDADAVAAALAANPTFMAALKQAAFEGAQRAERE